MELIPCSIEDLARVFAGLMPAKVYSSLQNNGGVYKDINFYPYDVIRYNDKDGNAIMYVIDVALAGFNKDEVRVNLKDQLLLIEVEKIPAPTENDSEEVSVTPVMLRRGISKKAAKLELTLTGIDNAKISAKFENGLLHIELPVISEAKDVKKIEVK